MYFAPPQNIWFDYQSTISMIRKSRFDYENPQSNISLKTLLLFELVEKNNLFQNYYEFLLYVFCKKKILCPKYNLDYGFINSQWKNNNGLLIN